ncbi:MAG TPA: DsbA family oxidoreductase [Alphaproteobacteria bacterium]|nr:DsbA family oxidoreductase [Alphaproteobacteria bacterium]
MDGGQSPKAMQIDFVSDVVCPWCVIGLKGLEKALENLKGTIDATIALQPFELNPGMAPEGQDVAEHVAQKFGGQTAQLNQARDAIKTRAADLGFTMAMKEDSRIYNSFDAHRLLHWAGLKGKGVALKLALFEAYFTDGANISDPDVLAGRAESVGLDPAEAREVLTSGAYKAEVLAAEDMWKRSGISAVPSVIVNRKYLISGGQPAAAYEETLRRIAAEAA